ncbi:MAG TPA: protein kinase [Candidatus Polarisedimenticolia bacterium]|nr:protein kinase [Candidatus Polarisedimenticolia bacterium]
MSLTAGTRLGPYEVVAPVGAGGMGEVYRARDTRLDRDVAIKVLPSHLSSSAEVRQRFEREAKTISRLSHPNICTLYDVGREGEIDYLVMEYLEGETLADRLTKGPLPLAQTMRCAIEMADALGRAHRQGIVHRDLKPGNIMLTRSGVKLLDYGLAKAIQPESAPGSLTSLPTEHRNLTQQGAILGTFQYMAPEQLEGKEADARTDLFAFGTVLYEMVTGEKAFSGQSQASLISAIMASDPKPVSAVRPATPPALDRVIKTCLAKDPDARWQSAHDLMRELQWISEPGSQGAPGGVSTARVQPLQRIAWGVTTLVLVATLVLAGWSFWKAGLRQAESQKRPIHASLILPEKSALRAVALSPDGTRLAFVARDPTGRNLLWIRPLDSPEAQALPGTDSPSYPFWSPDGKNLGFFADGKLKRVDAAGGPPQTLCDAPLNRGGSWNQDGVILFSPVVDAGLFKVSASGGVPAQVTRLDPARGESSHRWPFFLPDGKHFLYLVASFAGPREKTGIYVRSLDSNEEKFLVSTNSSLAYAPPGYLLFLRDRTLMAQPFDADRLLVTGDPFPMADRIQYFPQNYSSMFTVSQNGILAYQPRLAPGSSQLFWFDRSGKQIGSVGAPADHANPRISPDGKKIALDIMDPQTGNMDVWLYESSGGIATRFTSHAAIDAGPIWSPDGRNIALFSLRRNHPDIYLKPASGAVEEALLLESEGSKYPQDWSPDGRFILYQVVTAQSNIQLAVLPMDGEKKPYPLIQSTYGVRQGQFSPDGRYVAYASNESGKWEIVVAPFPGPGGNWQVSTGGGTEPRWRRDGKELFYLAPDAKLMSVRIKEGPGFDAEPPLPLFSIRRREPISSGDSFSYDVSADGQRFLVNTDLRESDSTTLTLLLNWTEGAKK